MTDLDESTWADLVSACERAYPDEACGWIVTAGSVHVATAGSREAFAFSDDDLLAFVGASRSASAPAALFHSHPDGDAEMSATDRAALALHPLPHLIIAVAGGHARAATLYAWRDGAHAPVARWRLP